MGRRVALVRIDVSEELIATTIIRVTRIGEQGTTLQVTSNRTRSILLLLVTYNGVSISPILVSLVMEAIYSFKNHTA
jgi:hypothetical protein